MYTTKLVHKNVVADNAYLHKGDTFHDFQINPFRQDEKKTGKGTDKEGESKAPNPFMTALVAHNAENGNFAKVKYVTPFAKKTTLEPGEREDMPDTIKYITTQPLADRKKGFGTRDANRRDEFCNDIRAQQYRENLYKEKKLSGENSDVLKERLTRLLAERAKYDSTLGNTNSNSDPMSQSMYNERVHQYDIGRSRITPFDPKSTKDSYYKFGNTAEKRFGEIPKPISYDIGESAWSCHYKPPSHGGKSEVKNFYDKSHMNVTTY